MISKPKSGPQDMPPKGGYSPIQSSRIAIRRIVSPTIATGLSIAALICGGIGFMHSYREACRDTVEVRSAALATLPIIAAARDREFLKQLKRNRDEEAKLMEDYPGWVVGTYFGEKIFLGEPEDKLIEPNYHEYVVHTDPADSAERYIRTLFL